MVPTLQSIIKYLGTYNAQIEFGNYYYFAGYIMYIML